MHEEQPSRLRLLIVEDEDLIRRGLIDLFTFHGFEVSSESDGEAALAMLAASAADNKSIDGIIADVMIPKLDGFALCDTVRRLYPELPVVLLTARGDSEDIILGLSLGADDYVTKPFSPQELVLRVKGILRRTGKSEGPVSISCGDLTINLNTGAGKRGAQEVLFTRREIRLLRFLLKAKGDPVSRSDLLSEVWGYSKSAKIETRTIDIHIGKLRQKIEPAPKNPRYLLTYRGEGYLLKV